MSETATLTIHHLGREGDGFAEWNGARVSVPFVLPGETVSARIEKSGKHQTGTLLEIVHPSSERSAPPCPHFGVCGNCRMQHAASALYQQWKRDLVRTALAKEGIDHAVAEMFFTPPFSRRRTRFVAERKNNQVLLGFHPRASHAVMDAQSCTVLKPELQRVMAPLRLLLQGMLTQAQRVDIQATMLHGALELVFIGVSFNRMQTAALAQWGTAQNITRITTRAQEHAPDEKVLETGALLAHYGTHQVALPPAPFLQASDEAEKAMLDFVVAHLGSPKKCADLFCGSGLFALGVHHENRHMLAVDADGNALAALRAAAQNLPHFTVQQRNLFKEPLLKQELKNLDCVILDPPRAGAAAQIVELAKAAPAKIIYVSCNPVSFAQDTKRLLQTGYRLTALKGFDQFLYSAHVEVIGVFNFQ